MAAWVHPREVAQLLLGAAKSEAAVARLIRVVGAATHPQWTGQQLWEDAGAPEANYD